MAMEGVRAFDGVDPMYDTLDYLGAGGFGSVTKVRKKADGRVYACKSIDMSSGDNVLMRAIQREIQVLKALKGCSNVVKWHDDISFDQAKQKIHLHMDFYSDGDLKHCIERHAAMGETFTDDFAMAVFGDIIGALKDVHAKGIVHRDIKPANILLDGNTAYLADFGLGKFSTGMGGSIGTLGSAETGTPAFMAPENFGSFPMYGPKSDIFALGCVMYQLCELRLAFRSTDRSNVPAMTSTRLFALKELVETCMTLDVEERPNTTTVMSHYQQILRLYFPNGIERHKSTLVRPVLSKTMSGTDSETANIAVSRKSTSIGRDEDTGTVRATDATLPTSTDNSWWILADWSILARISAFLALSWALAITLISVASDLATPVRSTREQLWVELRCIFAFALLCTMIGPRYALWLHLATFAAMYTAISYNGYLLLPGYVGLAVGVLTPSCLYYYQGLESFWVGVLAQLIFVTGIRLGIPP